jgi:hypothetical protein
MIFADRVSEDNDDDDDDDDEDQDGDNDENSDTHNEDSKEDDNESYNEDENQDEDNTISCLRSLTAYQLWTVMTVHFLRSFFGDWYLRRFLSVVSV